MNQNLQKQWFFDLDTAYNRIWIYDVKDENYPYPIRKLLLNNEFSSAMYLYSDELVWEYTKYYHLASFFNPWFKKTLMFGWAGYSFPKNFLKTYKNATIDVVEIDPELTQIAKDHFRLKDDTRLRIFNEDARVFMNNTKEKYDVIYWDAFSSHFSIPFQLSTIEAIQKNYQVLNDNWVVILNIIASIEWDKWEFLRAEYKTYKSVFPSVYIIPVVDNYDWKEVTNLMLVASKNNLINNFVSDNKTLNSYLENIRKKKISDDLAILTDDYAPTDYYIRNVY